MTLYTAAVLGFILGLAVSWGLHAFTGRALKDMVKRSREMADEAREMADASSRITADMDRRMEDLRNARRMLEDKYGEQPTSEALDFARAARGGRFDA
jgi:hypothetical protein